MTALPILLTFAIGFVIGRFGGARGRTSQNRGEALVSHLLQTNFRPPAYHLLNHVTLQLEDGTTEVDHILVSRFGVFVIETKDFKGWIFADGTQAKWTQVLFRYKFKFQNPIFQNFRHVQAVQARLGFLPPGDVKSVVVFAGAAEFKTELPDGVFYISELVGYLREQNVPVMSLNRMQFCVGRLETTRLAISGQTDIEHIESLARWHGTAN